MQDAIASLKLRIQELLDSIGLSMSADIVLYVLGGIAVVIVLGVLVKLVAGSGGRREPRPIEFDQCQHCGGKVIKGAMRCTHCGKMLITTDQQADAIEKLRDSMRK